MPSTNVVLNIYDLSVSTNKYLFPIGIGLHHTEVEIAGREFTFADGIFHHKPMLCLEYSNDIRLRSQLNMGSFDGGTDYLKKVLYQLENEGGFGTHGYCLLRRNCNDFCNALCKALVKRRIPRYINRLAKIGYYSGGCFLPPLNPELFDEKDETPPAKHESKTDGISNNKNKKKKDGSGRSSGDAISDNKKSNNQRAQHTHHRGIDNSNNDNNNNSPRQSVVMNQHQQICSSHQHDFSRKRQSCYRQGNNDVNINGMEPTTKNIKKCGNNSDAVQTAVVFGIKANGDACKNCIRQGNYCWQHKSQGKINNK